MSATQEQISELVAALVEQQRFFKSLSTEEAQWVIQHSVEAIGIFSAAVKRSWSCAEMVRSENFVARDHFVVGTMSHTLVSINFLNDNFCNWFLPIIETSVLPAVFDKPYVLDRLS